MKRNRIRSNEVKGFDSLIVKYADPVPNINDTISSALGVRLDFNTDDSVTSSDEESSGVFDDGETENFVSSNTTSDSKKLFLNEFCNRNEKAL